MAKLLAVMSALWFVLAVFAAKLVSSDAGSGQKSPEQARRDVEKRIMQRLAEGAAEKLLGSKKLTIEEIEEEIKFMLAYSTIRYKKFASIPSEKIELSASYLNTLAYQGDHSCHRDFLLNFDKYSKLAEPYPNVKVYLNHLYGLKLKSCEDAVVMEVREFKDTKPDEWNKVVGFHSDIDKLHADLQKACRLMEFNWPVRGRMEVVERLSPKIKEKGELADYIRYHRMCKLAEKTLDKRSELLNFDV